MLGRHNKDLIIRLLKITNAPYYHIVVARRRSAGVSRLDRIGSVASHAPYSWVKIDFIKLQKYLLEKNVTIAQSVVKVLGLDNAMVNGQLVRIKGSTSVIRVINKKQ